MLFKKKMYTNANLILFEHDIHEIKTKVIHTEKTIKQLRQFSTLFDHDEKILMVTYPQFFTC